MYPESRPRFAQPLLARRVNKNANQPLGFWSPDVQVAGQWTRSHRSKLQFESEPVTTTSGGNIWYLHER